MFTKVTVVMEICIKSIIYSALISIVLLLIVPNPVLFGCIIFLVICYLCHLLHGVKEDEEEDEEEEDDDESSEKIDDPDFIDDESESESEEETEDEDDDDENETSKGENITQSSTNVA